MDNPYCQQTPDAPHLPLRHRTVFDYYRPVEKFAAAREGWINKNKGNVEIRASMTDSQA